MPWPPQGSCGSPAPGGGRAHARQRSGQSCGHMRELGTHPAASTPSSPASHTYTPKGAQDRVRVGLGVLRTDIVGLYPVTEKPFCQSPHRGLSSWKASVCRARAPMR